MSSAYKRGFDAYVKAQGLAMALQPVLYWLCHYANDDGVAFPRREILAKLCGCSEAHIKHAIPKLCELNLIETAKVGRRKGRKQYRILLEPKFSARVLKTAQGYAAYLKSSHWQAMRESVLSRDNYQCTSCGSQEELHVHHRTYERLGAEHLDDLCVLCRECHVRHHGLEGGEA